MTRATSVLGLALVAFLAGSLGYLAGGGGRVAAPAAPPGFGGAPPSFAEVVAPVNPAVVHVDVIEDARENPHEGILDAPALDVPRRGEGSGFVVDPDGYILGCATTTPLNLFGTNCQSGKRGQAIFQLTAETPAPGLHQLHVRDYNTSTTDGRCRSPELRAPPLPISATKFHSR